MRFIRMMKNESLDDSQHVALLILCGLLEKLKIVSDVVLFNFHNNFQVVRDEHQQRDTD